jgi:hypothetical protein
VTAGATQGPGRVLDRRLRRDARAEVEWYFQLAETEMSPPSNFGAMVASVSPGGTWRTPEDQAEAATAHRRIRRWLYAMPNHEAGVLQAAYELRPWPRAVRARFGDLAGIAVRLMSALGDWPEDRRLQEVMDAGRARELSLCCADPAGGAFFVKGLKASAQTRLDTALASYIGVRGTGLCVVANRGWRGRRSP